MLEYDDRPCYLVKGDYVGKDTDGQYLINNVSIIEKIDTYRVKEKKQDEQKFEMKSPEESLGISSEEYNDIVNECLYGESNSYDKVEPKFHEGDWVVNKLGNSWHIDSFDKKNYQVSDGKGNYNYFPISIQDRMHLWTIQDAKDGDVLVYNNGVVEIILLFKEWKNGYIGSADAYVHMYNNKININNWCDCSYTAHPATKEQCDILFQKMKESGYEWDAEKKELNKIHVIDEGKAEMDYCFTKMMNGEKVSSVWSEVDEDFFNDTITFLKDTKNALDHVDWLKSLKERMIGKV